MACLIIREGAEWDLPLGETKQTQLTVDGQIYTKLIFTGQKSVAARQQILARKEKLAAYSLVNVNNSIKLAVFDTDSTFINQEVIDEIADFAGFKKEVSEITESAMRGELDFNAALEARVALLKGLSEARLDEVWQKRLTLTKGADMLTQRLKERQAAIYLISGGFTFFTERFSQKLNLNGHRANTLEIANSLLTGRTIGKIVNRATKAEILTELMEIHGASANETIAVGDGANDIDMTELSGLGIAFCAKQALEEATFAAIFERNLEFVDHMI